MEISIDPDCKLLLYADDSTILFSHNDPDQIEHKLGKVLETCSDWLDDNTLSLNEMYRVSKKNDATFNRYLFLYYNLNWYALNIYY